jgi:hypothetical protein
MPDSDKGFDMYHRKIETYICTKRNVFFDMATATMKSLKAGLNFTLKMGIFCPNNGEGLTLQTHSPHFILNTEIIPSQIWTMIFKTYGVNKVFVVPSLDSNYSLTELIF